MLGVSYKVLGKTRAIASRPEQKRTTRLCPKKQFGSRVTFNYNIWHVGDGRDV